MTRQERLTVSGLVAVVSGAIAFGVWQHSWYAGVFAFTLLTILERQVH
jgi:hypothetical protein